MLSVYRAATQSITVDEAHTWNAFASQRLGGFLVDYYDANNHVLNSLLMALSVRLFGLSELAVRLPSLMGCGLYLVGSWRLARLVFGNAGRDTAWSALVTALLVTNPFSMDHFSLARGYGMAVGLMMTGLCDLVRDVQHRRSGNLYRAAIFCGLSITANLTMVFPVTACAIAFVTIERGRADLRRFWDEFAVPAVVIPFVILIVPVSKAPAGAFYFGSPSLAKSIESVAGQLFDHGTTIPGAVEPLRWLWEAVGPASLALLTASAAWVLALAIQTRRQSQLQIRPEVAFFSIVFLALFGLITGAHFIAGLLYPLGRTALYFIPLGILTAASTLYSFRARKALRYGAAAMAAVWLAANAAQIEASYYAEWRFDAGTKNVAEYIKSRHPSARPLTIRASALLLPSLEFYRSRYHLAGWQFIDDRSPLDPHVDLWILVSEDAGKIGKLQLEPVFKDRVSGTVIAERGSAWLQ